MCGIFGVIAKTAVPRGDLELLATHAEQRGRDSSGLFLFEKSGYRLYRATETIGSLLSLVNPYPSQFVMGHSRLVTNGLSDNQPVYRNSVCVIHNGIVVNHESLWKSIGMERKQEIDTEIIAAIAARAVPPDDSQTTRHPLSAASENSCTAGGKFSSKSPSGLS